jgi:predicted RNA-binding protein associated with RNAse of E/G family
MNGGAGKGDARRPCVTHPDEESLRWAFALGMVSKEQFEQQYRDLLAVGKITRGGRIIHAGHE